MGGSAASFNGCNACKNLICQGNGRFFCRKVTTNMCHVHKNSDLSKVAAFPRIVASGYAQYTIHIINLDIIWYKIHFANNFLKRMTTILDVYHLVFIVAINQTWTSKV